MITKMFIVEKLNYKKTNKFEKKEEANGESHSTIVYPNCYIVFYLVLCMDGSYKRQYRFMKHRRLICMRKIQ